jgi:hypothetical protein
MRLAVAAALMAALAVGSRASASAPDPLPVGPFSAATPGTSFPAGWEPLTFEKIPRHTAYRLVEDGGSTGVRAQAHASASGMIRRVRIDPRQYPIVEWRWRALQLPEGNDPRTRAGDDYGARVYIAFEFDRQRAGALESLAFDAAKLLYGAYPPSASLNYVWDAALPAGTAFPSPYTERNRIVVVTSGAPRDAEWVSVRRNLLEDYRSAFGADPPMIEGVAIMTDADNTGGRAEALYGDIVFRKSAP